MFNADERIRAQVHPMAAPTGTRLTQSAQPTWLLSSSTRLRLICEVSASLGVPGSKSQTFPTPAGETYRRMAAAFRKPQSTAPAFLSWILPAFLTFKSLVNSWFGEQDSSASPIIDQILEQTRHRLMSRLRRERSGLTVQKRVARYMSPATHVDKECTRRAEAGSFVFKVPSSITAGQRP